MRWWLWAAVQAVDRIGGNTECGVETKGDIGTENIVVDRLGQGNDVEALLLQLQRVLLCATAAKTDQRIQVVGQIVLDDDIGHIQGLTAHSHLVWLVPTGT